MSPEEIDEARKLWADGFTTQEIADELGVDEYLVYNGRRYIEAPYLALPGVIQRRRPSGTNQTQPASVSSQKSGKNVVFSEDALLSSQGERISTGGDRSLLTPERSVADFSHD